MLVLPQTRDLVFLGGGHAHALVLRAWAMDPLPGVRLTLIDPNPVAPYTGMLPGLIAGHYRRDEIEIDLVRLARAAGARLILGRGIGLDLRARTVTIADRPPVAFDMLSIDIGISSDLPALPGADAHATAAKPLGGYATRWEAFVADIARGARPPHVAVIGAGLAGVELALAMDHRLRAHPDRRITLVERGPRALAELGPGPRARLLGELEGRGIGLETGAPPARVTPDGLVLADGRTLPAALTVSAAGARPQPWLQATGLDLTDGFVTVDAQLRSVSHPCVFAAGDCAHVRPSPRPKAGVYAVRQAPVLHHNLRAAAMGRGLKPWRAQGDHLKLTALGGQRAFAQKWGRQLDWAPLTPALWRLKDRIDRRFMAMFQTLPAMPAPALPRDHAAGLPEALGPKPLCGGCGAKLGPGLLGRVLAGLDLQGGPHGPHGPDSLDGGRGPGDDAALLSTGGARQLIATDHLRALTPDPFLMGRIAAAHALGDIFAMGATPQAALAQVILPPLSEPLQERTLAEVMAGILRTLAEAGTPLVGGHSSQGAELTVGLTVTGLAGDRILTKSGARPGDALILTRPLGSGTLLAAEMEGRAPGRAIAALWPALTRSLRDEAAILAPEARAMTDVTGFGLAGHLDEMLRPDTAGTSPGLPGLSSAPAPAPAPATDTDTDTAPDPSPDTSPDTPPRTPPQTPPAPRAATTASPLTGARPGSTADTAARPDPAAATADPLLGAEIDLAALPLLDGAEALAAAGIASSIAPANRAALIGRIDAPATARAALLFDPQTCGGLLAAVPPDRAAEVLDRLTRAGHHAARIGTVTRATPGSPTLRAR